MKNKKAQQEMVGFALIVVIVIIGLMVFLIISLGEKPNEDEGLIARSILTSILKHTTNCAIVYIPNYDNFQDLIKSCNQNKICSNLDKPACTYLNESLNEVLETTLSKENYINYYSMEYGIKNEPPLNKIESGNCTGKVTISQIPIISDTSTINVRLSICTEI